MKRVLLSITFAAAAAMGSAHAADLPVRTYTKAPVLVTPAYDWSGFYLGGHIGGGWGNKDWTALNTFDNIVVSGLLICARWLPWRYTRRLSLSEREMGGRLRRQL